MLRISSRATWIQKRLFPLLWFGFVAAFWLGALVAVSVGDRAGPWPLFLIMPVVMAIVGYFMMKKTIWPLMDEVWDAGDYLVVINRGGEERVALSDVINVSAPPFGTWHVSLRLRNAGRFGNEIMFLPEAPSSFNPFARNAVVEELITRVDRARSTIRSA
jgi:hypothetical protein